MEPWKVKSHFPFLARLVHLALKWRCCAVLARVLVFPLAYASFPFPRVKRKVDNGSGFGT